MLTHYQKEIYNYSPIWAKTALRNAHDFSNLIQCVAEGKIWPLWLEDLRGIGLEDKVHHKIPLPYCRIATLL